MLYAMCMRNHRIIIKIIIDVLSTVGSALWTDVAQDKGFFDFGECQGKDLRIIAMNFNFGKKMHILNNKTGQLYIRGTAPLSLD